MEISYYKMLAKLLCIFSIVNIIRDRVGGWATLLVGSCILLMFFLIIVQTMCWKSNIMILLMLAGLFLSSLFISDDLKNSVRYYPNWISAIFLFIIFSEKSNIARFCDAFKSSRIFIFASVLIFSGLILYAFSDQNCYSAELWGGYPYFKAYTTQHAVAASCCMVIALCILYYQLCEKSGILIAASVICMIAILKSGSRAFLFGLIVLSFLGCKAIIKNKRRRICMYFFLGTIMCYAILGSSIGEKFIYSIHRRGSESLLHKLTSGRSTFWLIDIKAFCRSNIPGLMLGNGFDYSYSINEKYYGMRIWAHNDLLETLLSTGFSGLILYLAILAKYIVKNIRTAGNAFSIVSYILIPSLINGNLNTQIYCLSAIILTAILHCQTEHSGAKRSTLKLEREVLGKCA